MNCQLGLLIQDAEDAKLPEPDFELDETVMASGTQLEHYRQAQEGEAWRITARKRDRPPPSHGIRLHM